MKLQEDMEFLESVREDVRNDMHEILVHRRTAEKEVLMKAMGNRWGSALGGCRDSGKSRQDRWRPQQLRIRLGRHSHRLVRRMRRASTCGTKPELSP